MTRLLKGYLVGILLLAFLLSALSSLSTAQDVVCSDGFGSFYAGSATGVALTVGPPKQQSGLADRACQAKLSWNNQELMLAPDEWQVDVDLAEADLGFGAPVVAIQTKRTDVDPLMRYEIYSLAKPPRKLRTITGGDAFSARDSDLDGQIEIWTHDAEAVNGFEGIPLNAFDFPPAMALRFEDQRLIDVSSEFPSHFDEQIATVRAQFDANELSKFKSSDGKLSSLHHLSPNELHDLMTTKIGVLEIVWGYLYSGREQEAWSALAEMWPANDVERIRTAIVDARERGIRRELDGISSLSAPQRRKKRAMIYEMSTENMTVDDGPTKVTKEAGGPDDKMKLFQLDAPPRPIFFRRPPPPDGVSPASYYREVAVDMVIDSAGKVWSIKTEGKTPDKELITASAEWRFVPGLKDGRPVASRMRMEVAPFR